jgi:hypothetical protein
MEAMEQNTIKNPGKLLEIQLALQDGDNVTAFSRIRQKDDLGGASFPRIHAQSVIPFMVTVPCSG